GLAGRWPPVQIAAVRSRKADRPEEGRALPVDCEEQGFRHELAGKLGDEAGRDDVFFAFFFDFNDREVITKLGRRVYPHKVLRTWLTHGDCGQQFLDAGRLGEGLVEAQIHGIKGIKRAWVRWLYGLQGRRRFTIHVEGL